MTRRLSALAVLVLALLPLSGCDDGAPTVGADTPFLNAPLKADKPNPREARLLPLNPGDSWDMISYCRGKKSNDRLVVAGPVTVNGVSAIQVNHLREGKLWRREIYRETQDELQLVATQDETSDLMRYDPPLPILRYPVNDGDYTQWQGRFILGKANFPASAMSRISAREKVRTPAGIFETLRIDTIVIVTQPGGVIRFPSIRWLSPGVGFVRRGFADQSRPAFAEVTKFNVP